MDRVIGRVIKDKAVRWSCGQCGRLGQPIPLKQGEILAALTQAERLGAAHVVRVHKRGLMRV